MNSVTGVTGDNMVYPNLHFLDKSKSFYLCDEYPDFMACEVWCKVLSLDYKIVSPPPGKEESELSPDLRVLIEKNRDEYKWRKGISNFVAGVFQPVEGQGVSEKMTVRNLFEVEKCEDDIDPDKYTPGDKHKTRKQLAAMVASINQSQLKNIYRANDVSSHLTRFKVLLGDTSNWLLFRKEVILHMHRLTRC